MRKRHIKSVAHWVIMCFILLFPIVMVGISSFSATQQEIHVTETYQYETNEVNSNDDLINGHIYKFEVNANNVDERDYNEFWLYNYQILNFDTNLIYSDLTYQWSTSDYEKCSLVKQGTYYFVDITIIQSELQNYQRNARYQISNSNFVNDEYISCYVIYKEINYLNVNMSKYLSASDYLGEKTISYNITDQTMRDDVNDWCSSFRNLPVNQWYGDMLDTIGLGNTTSMMMNVIYTYPLYVLWVYIIDLLVDCLLVIINFGHNALKRLGGENE